MKYLKYLFLIVLVISFFTISLIKKEKVSIKEIDNFINNKAVYLKENCLNTHKDVKLKLIEEKVNNTLNNMTIEEKIGQMIIISINNTSLTAKTKKEISLYHPGGVILFDNNLSDITHTRNFINSLQNISQIPLFISVDQEGGSVQRLKKIKGTTNIPTMNKVGKLKNKELTYKLGEVMGEELNALGFNMNFAPVIDVSPNKKTFINTRSFGSNPNIVSSLGISLAQGLESKKIIAVYKHFPGHGSTTTDSHYYLPILKKTKEELYKSDLVPFQNAIKNNAKVIMIGHLAVPNIDNKIPASLSKKIITNLLKEELGYNGLVITDALNMGALTNNYGEKKIYEMAINAGVDILLMPKSSKSSIKYIKQSIKEDKISIEQINSSVKKILLLKYTSLDNNILPTSYIGSTEHKKIVKQIKSS